jgi:hypothetical protein
MQFEPPEPRSKSNRMNDIAYDIVCEVACKNVRYATAAAALGSGGAADQGDHRAGGQAREGPPVDGEELIAVEDLVGVEGERGERGEHVVHEHVTPGSTSVTNMRPSAATPTVIPQRRQRQWWAS